MRTTDDGDGAPLELKLLLDGGEFELPGIARRGRLRERRVRRA